MKALILALLLFCGCGEPNGSHRHYVISKSHPSELLELDQIDDDQSDSSS